MSLSLKNNEIILKQKKEALLLREKAQSLKNEEIMFSRIEASVIKRDYLRDNFYKSLGILIFTLLTFISAIWYASYSFFIYSPPSKFLALNEEGRVLEEVPLLDNVVEEGELTQWVNDNITEILTYNYINYSKHGGAIKRNFTENGYSDFMSAFGKLKLQVKIKAQKAIVEPYLVEPLKVENTGAVAGGSRKAWMTKGTIVLNIHGKNGLERQKYIAKVLVIRTTFKENKKGLAIEKIQLIN